MKAAKKVKEALERRQAWWDNVPASGMRGNNTKMVQHDNKTKAFIRPGSQNRKKGSSGRKANR